MRTANYTDLRAVSYTHLFDEKTGSIFTQSTTLKICVEGERNIIIDNPTAIHYIACLLYTSRCV